MSFRVSFSLLSSCLGEIFVFLVHFKPSFLNADGSCFLQNKKDLKTRSALPAQRKTVNRLGQRLAGEQSGAFNNWRGRYFPQGLVETGTTILYSLSKSDTDSFPSLPPVSIFPPSVLMMEAEASPAETAPLCLTKQSLSDTRTRAELPSSTMLGRQRSPAALPEEKSEVGRRSQGSPTYIRSKMKVSGQEVDRAKMWILGHETKTYRLKI